MFLNLWLTYQSGYSSCFYSGDIFHAENPNVVKISGEFHDSGTLSVCELVQIVFANIVCSLVMSLKEE